MCMATIGGHVASVVHWMVVCDTRILHLSLLLSTAVSPTSYIIPYTRSIRCTNYRLLFTFPSARSLILPAPSWLSWDTWSPSLYFPLFTRLPTFNFNHPHLLASLPFLRVPTPTPVLLNGIPSSFAASLLLKCLTFSLTSQTFPYISLFTSIAQNSPLVYASPSLGHHCHYKRNCE